MKFSKRQLSKWFSFVHVPILAGRLRGKLWIASSRGKVLRHLLGTYEPEQTEFFVENVHAGDVVFDVGANLGHYSLLCSTLVGKNGKVLAFEPSPDVVHFLREHIALNKLDNIVVYEAAIGKNSGSVKFNSQVGSGTGRICAEGNIEVPLVRLDDAAQEQQVLPTHIKIDVEGHGHDVLIGGEQVIKRARPVVYISVHGEEEQSSCTSFLTNLGYRIVRDHNDEIIAFPEILEDRKISQVS